MNTRKRLNTATILIGALLILLLTASLLSILFPQSRTGGFTADVFQNGELITSIPLDNVREPYTFTVTGTGGCTNEIEVRPGSIGIISADCPDKLCVHQGFIRDSRLPVTCLPNRVVILLHENLTDADSATPDIITY